MITCQIPSKTPHYFSRGQYRGLIPKANVSVPDDISPIVTQSYSKFQFISKALQKFADHQLFGSQWVQEYLMALYRRNRSFNTIRAYVGSIFQFFKFMKSQDCKTVESIDSDDLSAFIEHLQDRGLKQTTVFSMLLSVRSFFYYYVDADRINADVLKRRLVIKLPQTLPRAIDPEDIRKLLTVIDNIRNRALILTLLRTGMRIGELLSIHMREVKLSEKRIEIYQAHKDLRGRVAYLSSDAQHALRKWIEIRETDTNYLFYGRNGRALSYETARRVFQELLAKAGLSQRGYTLHCLRHTFASELLNAGMRLECLQQLLGHINIEMTRRYARLTDNTRKEEYFNAMEIIERGLINGHYRRDYPLP